MTPRQLTAYEELHTRDEFKREARMLGMLRNSSPYVKARDFTKVLKKMLQEGE